MANIKWSEDKIRQFQAEGRGKGVGAAYRPWVEVTDFSSLGNSRRTFSHKTGRTHHLLSDVEWKFFVLLEFSSEVIDIREQFPLDREETRSIAVQKGIKHPDYPGTKVNTVMTTDFLVTFHRNNEKTLEAFSCKRTEDAEELRSLEKLEIEHGCFDNIGVPHHLVFHTELPQNKIKNLEWCRLATLSDDNQDEYEGRLTELGERMTVELTRPLRSQSLAEYCANFDARIGAKAGTGLRIARALIWERTLRTDLNQPNLATAPLSMFSVHHVRGLRIVGA